jgi:hypothetical protein
MASIPPPPDEPIPSVSLGAPSPGPSSRTTILAIVASVAVIATIATVLALAHSGGDAGASPSASPSAAPVTAPGGLAADAGAFRVVLAWTRSPAAVRYLVSRGGSVRARLGPQAQRWVDEEVIPETRYAYTVTSVGSDGTSAPARLTTRTSTAPPATARFEGTFDVHIHATSDFGFSNFGSANGNLGWRLTPSCAKGPCDVVLTDLHQKSFRMTMIRTGASYHGTATVDGRVRCGGTAVVSSYTVTVHLTHAGAVSGDWLGTRIEGSMDQFEPAQLGCVASGATYDVHGRVVRAGR